MSGAHVEVANLRITVRTPSGAERAIVDDVSFQVPRGQVLALIGESGSGKTTIALALMGFARPGARIAGGTIRVGDMAIDQLDDRALTALRGRRIAYIAQSAAAAFNPSRTIINQVIEPALVHGQCGRPEAEARAIELFRALALPDPETIGRRYPHQVSGGQLQRLMAAMALITGPELVILDEPTTALDVTTQVEVLKAFKAALALSGATAIYVSHDLAVVAQMADRIAVLNQGTLREEGPADALLARPQDEYTRTLLSAARPQERTPAAVSDEGALLCVTGLSAGYGKLRDGVPAIPVLSDIGFSLAKGATLGVIGESGSGKSTLARVIAGLLPRAAGSVILAGETLPAGLAGRTRDQFRRVQIVFQNADTALNPAHDVRTVLSRPLAFYHGLNGAAARARVDELLDLIRLPRDIATRPVKGLSGGQKQRVNLARALAAEPDVLLCDEVTSALDTVVGAAILELIDDLRRTLGIATVFISHDISKRLSLELGGNAPLIVFDDADLDVAVQAAMVSKFRNAGQTCVCANRILVHAPVYDEFAGRLGAAVSALHAAAGHVPGATMGPLINPAARDKVLAHVDDALAGGGRLLARGSGREDGNFHHAVLIGDAAPGMLLAAEETFGPVAPLFRFSSEAEAIALANDTPYGLASYFYTRDLSRAFRVAERLEAGMVALNTGSIAMEMAPFGGIKQSGLGREGGQAGIEEYLETKAFHIGGLEL